MFPAELYVPIYCYSLLALTCLTAAVYLRSSTDFSFAAGFNRFMLPTITGLMTLFIGLRPLSWMFTDMGTYVSMYSRAQAGEKVTGDWGFDVVLTFFSASFPVEVFFLFCAFLYVFPLAVATSKRHGEWGWSALLALFGSFSFFNYGVNGIRHGIAASLMIAALSMQRHLAIALLTVLAAYSVHKSIAIIAVAFLLARWMPYPHFWSMAWVAVAGTVAVIGERINAVIFNLLPALDDSRAETYLLSQGADKGGYRWDFLLYSSVPVIISYVMAPPKIKREKEYRVLLSTYVMTNTFWVLVIYAAFSNRFAYLSWCMLPWVVIYPFVGNAQKEVREPQVRPSTVLLALALLAHFSFTFYMYMFVA